MNFWIKTSLIFSVVTLVACKQQEEPTIDWSKDMSTEFGKHIAKNEDMDIELFIDQNDRYKFEQTGSGLRIAFVKRTDGQQAERGMVAEVRHKISLLDGTVCYQSELDKNDFFRIDKEDIESGIQEAIKLMRIGEKSKVIIPSHLGHGLVGDFEKIPPLSVLVVDLELVALK